jgi:hypothetical protein
VIQWDFFFRNLAGRGNMPHPAVSRQAWHIMPQASNMQRAAINAAHTRLTIGINALIAMHQSRQEGLRQSQQSKYKSVMYRGF